MTSFQRLRPRTRVGKYRIVKRLATGGFGTVYRAHDTVEGIDVALKVVHKEQVTDKLLQWFKHEARVHAQLDHPNVLPLKTAERVEGHLLLAYPLGERSLGDRHRARLTTDRFLDYAEQALRAVAHAHERGVMHCDLKPENFILFADDRLRLGDFGIAKVAMRTIEGSGSGTLGYMAPEQALGKPSLRSDVFALGLMFWLMLTGHLPEYPFTWPPPGYRKLRGKLHPDFVALLQRAMEIAPRRRFADAGAMLRAFLKLKPRVRRFLLNRRIASNGQSTRTRADWRELRFKQFSREHGGQLDLDRECAHCNGPVAEAMSACPWCGVELLFAKGDSDFPAECPRCHRGRKLDWRYCGWCYGGKFDDVATRSYTDRRYDGRCDARDCRGPLLPFMRYCPWCRRKVRRRGKLDGGVRCGRCRHAVLPDYWEHCPWCSHRLRA